MIKKALLLLLCINIIVSTSQAGIFDFLKQNEKETINSFYETTILPLNTPGNIKLVSSYMESKGVSSIKIHVTDYDSDFYIVKDHGVYTNIYPTGANQDKTITLSSQQIRSIASILQDGKITYFEKIELYLMFRSA